MNNKIKKWGSMIQRGKIKRSRFKLSSSEYISIFIVSILVIVACVSFMVLHYRQQAQQRASHEKVQLLIQQQKTIIEAQRTALGKLRMFSFLKNEKGFSTYIRKSSRTGK